ncbi:putative reverse transcriptase domain-containing protein [Tanacetum coccineum]|uniref:Reverse transcriptase domain-containing protein n=1 Tax=Tanacetum coccineum TaxID=301880 RepID=A0ABQ5G0A0_9ASTR
MINQGVTAALAARDADRNTNGDDSHISGTGVRRTEQTACECTYNDFLKCQPLNFKGTEGVAGLSQWFKRMESIFHISNFTVENQVKFDTCTLYSVALTWWNTHVKTVGHDAAYGMPWKTLMKMMTGKYYPRNEIKKLEMEIWDLKVKESNKIEKYVGGLPDMIHGSVVASKPKTMQEAVEIATELMDKKIHTFADRQTENKIKQDNNQQQQQQPQNKRQNTDMAYAAGTGVLLMPTLLITKGALGQYQAIIVCAEKIVRIPYENETLIVHGDRSNRGNEARLHIISYTKIQEYMLKGCPVFLANVTTKETEDKLKKKRLEDDKKEHEEHLKAVLELLKKEKLYAKFSKCEFWILKVQFLSHVIDSQGIHVDPAKIESIKDWESPKTPTKIRQFLGLAGYYRRFIEGFLKISKSMTKLTQKEVKFDWGDKQEAAFQLLK